MWRKAWAEGVGQPRRCGVDRWRGQPFEAWNVGGPFFGGWPGFGMAPYPARWKKQTKDL